MMSFDPYGNPTYFVLLFIALLPLMIGLLYGRRSHWYESLISFVFLMLTFGGIKWRTGIALIIYLIYQITLVWLYSRYRQRPDSPNKGWIFVVSVILAIIPLAIVKITPAVHHGASSIIGFLGISYLTFKVVQMIMETRDGTIKEFHPVLFGQFLLFFPTISSGPIDRYRRFVKDYESVPTREKYLELVEKGVRYIFIGFFYKFILAYIFGTVMLPTVEHAALQAHGISWALVGVMYTYSMDLFFDFAGYSLFAVGVSYLMGIETPMNFNQPFKSKNIKDFWNRWHMTLSFWFRDFIYMRLVFFMMKHKIFKSRITTANVAYVINMLIMGFWHGETWYYIVYGLFHGLAMVVNDAWLRFKKKNQAQIPHNKFTEYFAIFLTFNVVCFSFLIFSGFLNQLWFGARP
ncbi:D-alanyl-lipoteichoic acid biosynthesis protein DltB [Lactiplantibacillus mudanjiangensis]|uniref:Teichoic acid D-alanyltransferase n=1 Tax=Lactiplantibacillus mudanjiangensis TaxID=1296538 RepID=A0A660DZC6_9LACO|nr:D-alanyl-lipoteichoic acid biosynthesis protein DltB [Lactiplantibacillus mudanjiangensis]VDG20565.1 D-alanyl transfer protein DltB [Lactobacillus plantarum JDM1] [Lactiplantibacillus mudanjiangensis]VDG24555.1 D-alanyl transfer protein DltB [Lactobacillus plantarum JDM1] [Lactiplantibacillus mudanjiangensis]VDG28604.1 D-alanyl transfer protein DltB [Lactobacillus plantarum JDM1] [Lactiplantibacillus mudanjiangensis]VDG30697.1 D-alanyl transfer protein DltB [Lactobacillus plantarum JDM1] [La